MADRTDGYPVSWDLSHPKRFPLHVHISLLFTMLLLVTGLLIGLANYAGSKNGLTEASREHFERLAELTEINLDRLQAPVSALVALLSRTVLADAQGDAERRERLPLLLEALSSNPFLAAVYAGYDDGDFFIVRHLQSARENEVFDTVPGTRFLVQSMERTGDAATGRYTFLDSEKREIGSRPMTDLGFDPRVRPWFREALRRDGVIRTAPYVFYATRDVGQTFACRASHGRAVIGADITLSLLSKNVADMRPTPSARLFVFDGEGRIVADSRGAPASQTDDGGNPILLRLGESPDALIRRIGETFLENVSATAAEIADDSGREWTVALRRIGKTDGDAMFLAIATPLDELLSGAWAQVRRVGLLTAVILLFCVPLTWYLSRRVSRDLRTLAGVAESIRHFDFASDMHLVSWVKEVQELSDDLSHTQTTIRKFLELSATTASERDFSRLGEFILLEMMRTVDARAGVLYLLSGDDVLKPECARLLRKEGDAAARDEMKSIDDVPPLSLRGAGDSARRQASAKGEPVIAELSLDALPSGSLRELWGGDPVQSMLVPLRNNEGANVGLIALYRSNAGGDVPEEGMIAFIRQLSGVAAIALENHRLLLAQEDLMQAMIRILAGAIDAKSPYTGGHCQRVPVIAFMLAEAACDATAGPYAGYRLDKEAWDALRVAAWLHDCGKVTTPEYVVDKATKLEAIYDRIHEVRMRFEVIKREAEIECLKTKLAGGDPDLAERRLAEAWREIDDDFAFVAQCNEGGEAMRADHLERLAKVAKRSWTRTLSDRLGVSWEEKRRRESVPEAPLPVVEPLLADRPEHLVARPPGEWSETDNPWGFTMKVPKHKFNRGELTNLSIARGTLSEEERFIINDHIIQTIIMLSRMPFPDKLRRVPEMAGGHHERMDGKGYPRGLTGDRMSAEARMMAIADVFEALTAADRPYKRAKTLSESLAIMANMVKGGHLDPELFELFLSGGVHLRYAREHLAPEQNDAVDVETLLAGIK